jgi:hypothetical protein
LGGIFPPGPNAGLRSLKALTDIPDPAAYIYLARTPFETAGHKCVRHGRCAAPPLCLVVGTGVTKTQSKRRQIVPAPACSIRGWIRALRTLGPCRGTSQESGASRNSPRVRSRPASLACAVRSRCPSSSQSGWGSKSHLLGMAHLPSAEGATPLNRKSYHPLSLSAAHDGTLLPLAVGNRVSKRGGASSASWLRGPANFTGQRESGRPTLRCQRELPVRHGQAERPVAEVLHEPLADCISAQLLRGYTALGGFTAEQLEVSACWGPFYRTSFAVRPSIASTSARSDP